MLQVVEKGSRYFSDMGWLKTCWLFSFADYYDPENINHGALRVFNDDIVQPHSGFGTHPHEEMEIISIVLHGEMTHKDTMGNEMVIKANDVQRMTAGTGLQHSEWNHADDPVAFFQIWIVPDKKKLAPSYDQKTFSSSHWHNRLALVASSEPDLHAVGLNSEASVFRAALEKGLQVSFEPDAGHYQFIYVIDGRLKVNSVAAESRDQVRIKEENRLIITADQDSEFIMIDVPK